jgi:RNA polymerase sigma-54 factor
MKMVQQQKLAPRMIQSMEILQLPIMALEERIEQEIAENPCLERADTDPDLPDEEREQVNPDAPTAEEKELVVDETKNNEDDFERLLNLDEEWPDTFEERPRPSSTRLAEESDRKHDAMANMVSRPQSLHDYLRDQLGWFDLDARTRAMCERIIYSLDSNGYLPVRLEELIDPTAGAEDLEVAKRALTVIHKLDPPGVGARDLRECLLLQLMPGMHCYEQMRTLVSSHLEDLEHNRLPVIERRTGYSMELIQETLGELRKLNPKPGALFSDVHAPTVTPDIFLEVTDDGTYRVFLEDGRTPTLFVSPYYRKLLQQGKATDAEREWIKRKLNSAQWLIDSIEQRRNTLTRVAQAIVDHQTAFLSKGPEHIEPLKMQQIADKVGVHVTTVSRAVDDKWIQTPRGIFPLKRFFGGGTVSASGEEVAWDTVRLKLQEIVDHESKQNPYSDDELVKELAKHGLTVARRTVTKYRKAMNIPSSRQRRDWTIDQAAISGDHETNVSAPSEVSESQPPALVSESGVAQRQHLEPPGFERPAFERPAFEAPAIAASDGNGHQGLPTNVSPPPVVLPPGDLRPTDSL